MFDQNNLLSQRYVLAESFSGSKYALVLSVCAAPIPKDRLLIVDMDSLLSQLFAKLTAGAFYKQNIIC